MKKCLFLLLLSCSAATAMWAQRAPQFSRYLEDGIYVFDDEFKVKRTELFTIYKAQFGLTPMDEMVLDEEQFIEPTDPNDQLQSGSTQARYRQYHKGFLVETRHFNVVSKCNVALMVSGSVIKNMSIDEHNTISEAAALQQAMTHVNPSGGFVWQNPVYVQNMQRADRGDYEDDSTGYDSTRTFIPKGQLLVAQQEVNDKEEQDYALCWKFDLRYYDLQQTAAGTTDSLEKSMSVYVDAHTGAIYNSFAPEMDAFFTNGSVWTPYDGNMTIESRTCTFCSNYTLEDSRNIKAFDASNSGPLQVVKASNNSWVTAWEKEIASPYWCIERAYDYYRYHHGLWNGNELYLYARSRTADARRSPYAAMTTKEDAIYVPQNGVGLSNSWAAIDVMGHEFTHLKIGRSSKVGAGQPATSEPYAINEGFADVFGFLVETWNRGWADWNIGENLGSPQLSRSMHSPSIDVPASSDWYQDANWGNNGPYSRSGPLRKWFTHLSQGEWNWTPAYSGVGLPTAERLALITMYWWLWQGSDYHHLRNQTLAVADVHYGGVCGPVWRKVLRAWNDVGVFGPATPCRPWGLKMIKVAGTDQLQSGNSPIKVAVKNNFGADELTTRIELVSCNWNLPAGWTGTFNPDNTEFTLTGVNDFNSHMLSVDVAYLENGALQNVTLSNVLHFSDDCSSANEKRQPIYAQQAMTNKDITVYPNPASNELTIVLPGNDNNIQAQLIDIAGRTLYTSVVHGGVNQLKLPPVPNGVYLLKMNGQQLQHTERVTIQR